MSEREENELLCAKVLGWRPMLFVNGHRTWGNDDDVYVRTPAFDNWHDAGLLIDALQASVSGRAQVAQDSLAADLMNNVLTPFAIREAALEYARSL